MEDVSKVTIEIFDEISADTLKEVLHRTKDLPDGSEVELLISSYGGEILYAFSIIDALKRFKTKSNILGFACSAAAIIAISCMECSMSEIATMLLHSAWAVSVDGTDPGIKRCNELQLDIIHKRCPEFDAELLETDTWLSAEECLKLHLADNIYIDVPIDFAAKYAAKLCNLTIKGDVKMDEKIQEVIEEVKELPVEETVAEDEKVEEENHDLVEVIEKLSEELNALKARVVALEEVKEEEVVEEDKLEAECGDRDPEQDRINNIYKNIVTPQAKVAIGAPKASAKVVHKVDYKSFKSFIDG